MEVKSQKWFIASGEDSDEDVMPVDGMLGQVVAACYDKCQREHKNLAKAVKFNHQEHVLYFDVQRMNGSRPFMLNMAQRDAPQIELKLREKITRWDFLSTFKPPEDLSIESGNIYRTEKLAENSPDYEHVSKAFLSTFGAGSLPWRSPIRPLNF